MNRETVCVKFKAMASGARLPQKATAGSACYDVFVPETHLNPVKAGETTVVKLGFAVEIPSGYEIQVKGRSGLAKKGILIQPGCLDPDFRGEIGAIVTNLSGEDFFIAKDMRIAQIKIAYAPSIMFVLTNELGQTARGEGGFGSTG